MLGVGGAGASLWLRLLSPFVFNLRYVAHYERNLVTLFFVPINLHVHPPDNALSQLGACSPERNSVMIFSPRLELLPQPGSPLLGQAKK